MPRLIYVLKNKAMLGLVKIGLTTDSRISNLSSSTGVALSFECHFASEIPEEVNLVKLEKTLHQRRLQAATPRDGLK